MKLFSREFRKVEWTSSQLRRTSELAGTGGTPADLIVLVVTVVANILQIAEILAKRLDKGKNTIIRLGKREIELKGSWKSEEIAQMLKVVSSATSRRKAIKEVLEAKSSIVGETEEQIADIDKTIKRYEKLVQVFEGIAEKQEWQVEKVKEYRKTLSRLQRDLEYLQSFLNELKMDM